MRHRPRSLVRASAIVGPSVFAVFFRWVCFVFLVLATLFTVKPTLADDPETSATPSVPSAVSNAAGPKGELKIEGVEPDAVERLTLDAAGSQPSPANGGLVLEGPGTSVLVPVGAYRIKEIELRGGIRCFNPWHVSGPGPGGATPKNDLTISEEKPCSITIGRLRQLLRASCHGQNIDLSYDLVDQEGRVYSRTGGGAPPSFTVSCNGREIGSGTFAYG